MMTFSFNTLIAPARTSKDGSRSRSGISFHRWFGRAGRASALAACLMTAAPPWCSGADEPSNAAEPIAKSSEATVEQLLLSLKSQHAHERKSAVEKLGRLGSAANAAVPALLKTLHDNDPLVRASAARAVWDIDQKADEAVPVLFELLGSQVQSHRELAAYFLGPMGSAAKAAVPALRGAMSEADVMLRIHAAEALTQIEPTDTKSVDILLAAMHHADANVRSLAAMAIGNVAPIHAEKVVPVLTAALADPDPGVRAAVEVSLPSFNLDVAHSGQNFPNQTADEISPRPTEENVSPFAQAGELPNLDSALAGELQQAIQDLSHADVTVRKNALERISWIGPDAKPALTKVAACLKDSQPEVRAYAAKTLWDVDQSAALPAIQTLQEMVDSTEPGVRPLAAFYLGYMGRAAASALPTLKRALANAESTEQLQIAEAVARVNPEDGDAVTVLIGGLRDPDSQVRFQAAYALGEVSPIHAAESFPNWPPPRETKVPKSGKRRNWRSFASHRLGWPQRRQ